MLSSYLGNVTSKVRQKESKRYTEHPITSMLVHFLRRNFEKFLFDYYLPFSAKIDKLICKTSLNESYCDIGYKKTTRNS